MTNTHRKSTNRTTARIAAVGAFGIGAAIAFPGLAAAQESPAETSSLEGISEEGNLEGAFGTDIGIDAGSLALNVNLDAETPTPGSVEFGSLGVSPNTGSDLVDEGSGDGSLSSSEDEDADADADAADEETADDSETGSLSGALAGLSSGAEDDATA